MTETDAQVIFFLFFQPTVLHTNGLSIHMTLSAMGNEGLL